ncbi:MAG: RdgB/HAM1 family non-canonical purine NTP pyrophosphatase [Synergistes sp.]|nr:RdgB/HAM1 family non-canonical purine NTP pyrophosphatase [Synergistes sp.]
MQMILASTNRGKYAELKDKLAPMGIDLLFGGDFDAPLNIEETGSTYEENAELKARAWVKATGTAAMADDSGLEVDALGGKPGIHSARAVSGSDADRVNWLLKSLNGKTDRSARFACAIVVIFASGKKISATEYCNGKIALSPAGTGGFGYDPIFIPDGYDKTFAQIGSDIKNKISHRAKAVKTITQIIKSVVQF